MKHNKKDKKKKFHNNHHQDKDYYTNPIKGYLITADQHREKNAVKDAFNFLNKVLQHHFFNISKLISTIREGSRELSKSI